MVIFDYESISVQEDKFRETDTTNRIGKHVAKSVSFPSNFDRRADLFKQF